MKEILLLQPRVGDMDWMRSSPALPLGLLHASSLVSKDYRVKIIDQRTSRDWERRIREEIRRDPLLVGITSFTGPMILEALRMCDRVREISSVPIVWGGVHPSLLPESTLRDGRADFVVRGEGEETLRELAGALDRGGEFGKIMGLGYKDNGRIMVNEPRDFLDLDRLPDLPYHLVNVNDYMPLYQGQRSFYFQASRGCPFSCAYCYNPVFNRRRLRKLSPGNVLERLQNIVGGFRPENIYFVDDNFFLDLEWAREIIRGIRKLGVTWQVQGVDITSIKKMDDGFLDLLRESRCLRVTIGIESGSPRIRNLIGKAGDLKDITEQIGRLNRKNINIFCSFMAGFPSEERTDVKMTIDLLFRLIAENPLFQNSPVYCFTPYPGTALFDQAVRDGYDPPATLTRWGEEGEWKIQSRMGSSAGKDKINFSRIYFVSNFLDTKTPAYHAPWLIRQLSRLYGPVARFRLKHLFLDFLWEEKLAGLGPFIWSRFKRSS